MGNIKSDVPHFVALDDEMVVGWCDVLPSNRPAFAHWGILGLGLLPDYRGQGIGKKLLLTTLRKAKEQGMEKVQVSVYTSNKAAISLYNKIGFKEEGLRRKVAKIDGRYEDDYIMALFLNEIEL